MFVHLTYTAYLVFITNKGNIESYRGSWGHIYIINISFSAYNIKLHHCSDLCLQSLCN